MINRVEFTLILDYCDQCERYDALPLGFLLGDDVQFCFYGYENYTSDTGGRKINARSEKEYRKLLKNQIIEMDGKQINDTQFWALVTVARERDIDYTEYLEYEDCGYTPETMIDELGNVFLYEVY